MKAGDAFYLPDWSGGHINFAIEVFPDGSVITCNFTNHTRTSDKTCVVVQGEHPSITKTSVVNFAKAHHCEAGIPLESLKKLIESHKPPLSAELLARIRQGALDSPRTPDKIKDALVAKPQN